MTCKRLRRPTGTANVGIFEAGLARAGSASNPETTNPTVVSLATRATFPLSEDHLDCLPDSSPRQ
jgi:hypothetical protein